MPPGAARPRPAAGRGRAPVRMLGLVPVAAAPAGGLAGGVAGPALPAAPVVVTVTVAIVVVGTGMMTVVTIAITVLVGRGGTVVTVVIVVAGITVATAGVVLTTLGFVFGRFCGFGTAVLTGETIKPPVFEIKDSTPKKFKKLLFKYRGFILLFVK